MYGMAAASTSHVRAAAGANRTTDTTSTAIVRAATSAEPRSRTFQPACRNAAASASARALSGTYEDVLGGRDERGREPAAVHVPGGHLLGGLRTQAFGIRRRIVLVRDPAVHLLLGHLGMELHRPAGVAEAERLRAVLVARQLDSACRDLVGVVVPFERLEAV